MTIFCIGGVSGSGKSTYRRNDGLLSSLPCIDIADIYDEYNNNIGREAARIEMLDRLEYHLQQNPDESIVLEAFFAPGKLQRKGVENLADEYNQRVRYIWFAAPREECWRRIMDDQYVDDHDRHQARCDFVDSAPGKYFYERDDEQPPDWLYGRCQRCGEWPAEAPNCSECGGPVDCDECTHCADYKGVSWTCSRQCQRRRQRSNRSHGYSY